MAGIAGIYCADGRAADAAELKRMVAAVEHRGPDGIAYWNAGPVALAHLQFCTTPESVEERQPLVSPDGAACLVWNGRVDNREELLAALEAAGAVPVDATDAGLALAAYLAWGPECARKMVGDFALAVWDARERRLWCARDYIGIRPFYYFWDGKTFLFGPEIRSLLAHPLVSLKINEGMVGEYIEHACTSRDETLYTDIRRLPSGCFLTVDGPGGLRIDSWWKPELGLLEYGTDEEYAERFRELFDQSIRAQTRCRGGWGIQLSGGLDSSSVAVSSRAVTRGEILTFSIASPGKPWDESEDIAAVVEKAELRSELVPPRRVDLEFFRRRAAFWKDFPGNPNGEPMTIPMYEAAGRHGARVLLSGIGGDEWLDGDPQHLVDLAVRSFTGPERGRAMGDLLDRAKADCGGRRHWSVFLARRLLVAAAPDWAKTRRMEGQLARNSIFSTEFLRRTNLAERIAASPNLEGPRFCSRAQRNTFRAATEGAQSRLFEWNDRESAYAGMELRFPFFDRRLAEFCLRLPEDQRQRGAHRKRLLRNAMRERLPARVLEKTGKAEFSELFERVFRGAEAVDRRGDLAIVRDTDWVDPGRLKRRLTTLTAPEQSGPWPLWMLLGVDLWFESVASSSR